MFDYWKRRGLVQLTKLDDSVAQAMRVASSPQEWCDCGKKLFHENNFAMATMCFERAGDMTLEKLAKASGLRASAEQLRETNPEAASGYLREAAEMFEFIGRHEAAASCYRNLAEYEQAGNLNTCMPEDQNACNVGVETASSSNSTSDPINWKVLQEITEAIKNRKKSGLLYDEATMKKELDILQETLATFAMEEKVVGSTNTRVCEINGEAIGLEELVKRLQSIRPLIDGFLKVARRSEPQVWSNTLRRQNRRMKKEKGKRKRTRVRRSDRRFLVINHMQHTLFDIF